MVDPQVTPAGAEKPVDPTERPEPTPGGLGSSEDEPADGAGAGAQRSPAPLLDRIRRDRADLEAKIAKLKGYIKASTEMMNKMKNVPEMRERYESLSATRADLVQNAVNLQQILVKLKESEDRASNLAGRERALVAETQARQNADFSELQRELPPEVVAELDPEDRANYEKKRELLQRINQSQEKLRAMEAEQQRLRMMKENVEWKLAEARASRMGLQDKAHELLHDMPGVHPAAAATNWESTTAPDRSALASLNERVAALQSLPEGSLEPAVAADMQRRLQALAERRQQLDELAGRLADMTRDQQRRRQDDKPSTEDAEEGPPAEDSPAAEAAPPPPEAEGEEAEAWRLSHAAAMADQRERLQQLERSVQAMKETLGQEQTPEQAEQARQEQERSQQLLEEQEERLKQRAQQVEETRRQLDRLKQLMASVEAAHASGQRLSEAVPRQLTELLASVGQLDGDGGTQQTLSSDEAQSQATEYVELLQRLHDSIDSISGLQQLEQ